MKKTKLVVKYLDINTFLCKTGDYISLTDIAKYKNSKFPADLIKNWLRTRSTIEFLGFWEKLYNPKFKLVEFDQFKNEAGSNSFVLSPQKWINETKAIGILSKSGRCGGTFAYKDIAFEFAMWISVEFKLYLIKEFERLKEKEQKNLKVDWDIKRVLAKVNYRVHTDAVKENLIPPIISKEQAKLIYASEADVLNMALYGITAKGWRRENKGKTGNIRDYSNVLQLVCLAGLESLNAEFIRQGLSQEERLLRLNKIAIIQMESLGRETVISL